VGFIELDLRKKKLAFAVFDELYSLEIHEMEFLVFFLLIFRELKIIMKNGGILKRIFRWASML
jgi:hypothetical protein